MDTHCVYYWICWKTLSHLFGFFSQTAVSVFYKDAREHSKCIIEMTVEENSKNNTETASPKTVDKISYSYQTTSSIKFWPF